MGKTRRNSNTNSGRTSHDAATTTNLMNNMMEKNPMHTHESGAQGVNNLLGGMMANLDGFVDKMDNKVAGIFGEGINPGRAVFNQQAADNGYSLPPAPMSNGDMQAMTAAHPAPPVNSAPQPAAPAAPPPPPAEPAYPEWMSKLDPKAQEAVKGWLDKRQERIERRDARRARADQFLGLEMNRRRGAGESYDL